MQRTIERYYEQIAEAEDRSSNNTMSSSVSRRLAKPSYAQQSNDKKKFFKSNSDANSHLASSMERDKKQRAALMDRTKLADAEKEIIELCGQQNASAERQLSDARAQITSLQNILAETHQMCQATEKKLHESETRHAEKDATYGRCGGECSNAGLMADRRQRITFGAVPEHWKL